MAYLIIMALVPAERVAEITAPGDLTSLATKVASCSHLVVTFCPALEDALDGGVPLDTPMWHPLRSPVAYSPPAVPAALARLEAVAADRTALPAEYADWVLGELARAIDLYRHAASAGEAVVSLLNLTRSRKRD